MICCTCCSIDFRTKHQDKYSHHTDSIVWNYCSSVCIITCNINITSNITLVLIVVNVVI